MYWINLWEQEVLLLSGLSHILKTQHKLAQMDRMHLRLWHWKMGYLRVLYLVLFYLQYTQPFSEIFANMVWTVVFTLVIFNWIYHFSQVQQFQSRTVSKYYCCPLSMYVSSTVLYLVYGIRLMSHRSQRVIQKTHTPPLITVVSVWYIVYINCT